MNYDALIEIPNLRFCLAHVSWPWYDECIAEYGKFAYNKRVKSNAPEMFIDVTPGTPPVYREEVFRHLLLSYNMRNNLMFGTDCNTDGYSIAQSTKWQNIDDPLYERFVEGDVEDFKEHIYGKNFLRFIGKE
jgi:predicted TIM-barrel fold metal-dependent hydrolase